MDAKQILNLLNDSLSSLSADIEIFKEANDVLRIEVISPLFKGMRLSKRIDLVTEKILSLCQNELSNYSIVINSLTRAEKDFGVSETLLHVWYGRSCIWFPMLPKVPEMEFSDKVDIKNVQVCCTTPSELGDRVS